MQKTNCSLFFWPCEKKDVQSDFADNKTMRRGFFFTLNNWMAWRVWATGGGEVPLEGVCCTGSACRWLHLLSS